MILLTPPRGAATGPVCPKRVTFKFRFPLRRHRRAGNNVTLRIDIDQAVSLLIEQYGQRADLYAAACANAMLELGTMEGAETWLLIVKEIRSAQAPRALVN